MSHHLNEEFLQRQRADLQGTGLLRRVVEDIARHKAAHGVLPDDVPVFRRRFHVLLQPADAEGFCLHRLQGVKEAHAAPVDEDQLLDRLCDLLDDVGGDEDDPGVLLEALRQHVVKLHAHEGVKAEHGFIQEDDVLAARQADDRGNHGLHAEGEVVKLLLSLQLKAVHHLRRKVVIVVGVDLRGDPQQLLHGQVKMLGKVLDVADARVQSRGRDRLAVDLDAAARDVLIPGNGFEQRRLPRAVPAQQAVNPRILDR